ncbi:MAG: TIGR00725 family protein [Bryobacterales bacterium]|nr:TIGR00725 family protein [Bryobacteraceae bacterium]MDW8129682.1 TIGR00725 family protein [Bryobacterales bacterium]
MQRTLARRLQAAVIGDSDPPGHVVRMAEEAGRLLARLGITVVCGGLGGVMEGVSRGAREAGGLVIGIVPSSRLEDANPWCSVVIPTGMGHGRNVLTALAGDFVVALGGGAGTLSEICFAWIHGRPIFVLTGAGGWADRLGGKALDARSSSTVRACASLEELERALREAFGALLQG